MLAIEHRTNGEIETAISELQGIHESLRLPWQSTALSALVAVRERRAALVGPAAEDRFAAGRLAGLREAAAVAIAYEQKCDAEAEKHDWRKNDVASIPDAMRIKEAWEERGESALVIRESIEALERMAGEGA